MESIRNDFSSILNRLGYDKSIDDLYTIEEYMENQCIDLFSKKLIKKLKPDIIFCPFNKPFILFYSNRIDKNLIVDIWNAQIPLVFCYYNNIMHIYNGSQINKDYELKLINRIESDNNECNDYCYQNIKKIDTLEKLQKYLKGENLYSTLLQNLQYITNKISVNFKYSTKLILALLFTNFLIDRQVDIGYEKFDKNKQKESFLESIKNRESINSLFQYLKQKFNGNLFDDLNIDNLGMLTESDLKILHRFFEGKELMFSGQLALFSLYNFDIIPIELISNIYEVLLGPDKQNNDKAYYTPAFLVDYINNNFVSVCEKSTILDPSCGSGIFLIKFYRNLIEKNIGNQEYCNNDKLLIDLLQNCIFGVDKNEESIDVTIFSLYLTMLDYKDPKSLENFKLPKLKGNNLLVGNFFDIKLTIKLNKKFDYIIGNPPWGNVKDNLFLEYCKKNKIPNQNNEIARAFMLKVLEYAKNDTEIVLILPSKIFYNYDRKAKEFRNFFLKNSLITNIVELSNIRKQIFKNAIGPALIIKYKKNNSFEQTNTIKYLSMKSNLFYNLFKVFVIESKDYKFIKQKFLYDNDWAWKTFVYGTMLDCYVIKNLFSNYPSLGEYLRNNHIIYGTGMLTNSGSYDTAKFIGEKLIDGDCIDHYRYNDSKSSYFNFKKVHRARNEKLFEPPYALTKVGINMKNFKMKAIYSEEQFVYKRSVIGLKGSQEQRDILLNIVGLLNSSLYAYLNLMIGSSAGIEREQSIFEQTLEYPFIFDNEISDLVDKIQKEKAGIMSSDYCEEIVEELDRLILNKFKLDKKPCVDYALRYSIPFATHTYNPQRVNTSDLNKYVNFFRSYWKNLDNDYNFNICYNIGYDYTVVRFSFDKNDSATKAIDLDNISKLIYTKNGGIINNNNLYYFDENSYYIIKNSFDYNWHIMNAEIDLQSMVSSIILEKE